MTAKTTMRATVYTMITTVSLGVGHWLIQSIGRRDYPALQGGIMLISSLVILANLFVDTLYGLINPRIRHAH